MIFRHLFGVTKVASDIFFTCMFWFCFVLLVVMGAWELIERLFRGPAEQPAPRAYTGEQASASSVVAEQAGEPDEWEKLSDEEKAELKRFFK